MTYKKVKLIERSLLPLDERVELLLIYANQKPATILYVSSRLNYNINTNTYEFSEKQLRQVKKLLDRLKIPYETGKLEEFERGQIVYFNGYTKQLPIVEIVPIYIGQTEEQKDSLISAKNSLDDYEFGRQFGFPETAIQAFLGKRPLFMGCKKKGIPLDFFTQFVFSQEYFKEELESTSKKWHDTIKRLSPKIYKEVKEEAKKNYNPKSKSKICWRNEDGIPAHNL